MGFGQGIAQSFEIPMPQQARVAAGGSGAGSRGPAKEEEYDLSKLGLDKPPMDLQSTFNTEERMAQFYADWADVVSFAKTMHKQYGIDVMAPKGEFAVRASANFQKKLANLWATQNAAKNSEVAQRNLYNSGLSGAVDVNQSQAFGQGQFLNEVPMDQQFVSNRLPDYLEKGGAKTSRAVDNAGDLGRLNKDWQAMVTQAQNVYQAAPTEENRRRLEFVMTQRPTFNTEGQGKAKGEGNDFVGQHFEKVALLSKHSNKYFTPDPSGRVDSKGGRIGVSNEFRGTKFGFHDAVDAQGRRFSVPFTIDHLESRPGENIVVAVNDRGEQQPFSTLGVRETIKNLGQIPNTQLYKYLSEHDDVDGADSYISEENRPTIPTAESLSKGISQNLEQRANTTSMVEKGIPRIWPEALIGGPVGRFISDILPNAPTQFKDANGNSIEVKPGAAGLAKLQGTEWTKLFGKASDVTVDNQTITKQQAMNGIPTQVMVRLLEEKGFITYKGEEGITTKEATPAEKAAADLKRLREKK